MNGESKIMEKAFDAIVDNAAFIADENLVRHICEPEEEIEFSCEHEKRMQKLFRKEKHKTAMRKVSRFTGGVVSVMLAVVCIASVLIYSIAPWREAIYSFLSSAPYSGESKLPAVAKTPGSYSDGIVAFDYLPVGYEVSSSTADVNGSGYLFTDGNMYFRCSVENRIVDLGAHPKHIPVEEIEIQEHKGYFSSMDNNNALTWSDGLRSFRLQGSTSKKDMINVANNIRIVGEAPDVPEEYRYYEYSNDNIIVGQISSGFVLAEEETDENGNVKLLFVKGDEYFRIDVQGKDADLSVAVKGATTENRSINDCDALFVKSPGFNAIIWKEDKHTVRVSGNSLGTNILSVAGSIYLKIAPDDTDNHGSYTPYEDDAVSLLYMPGVYTITQRNVSDTRADLKFVKENKYIEVSVGTEDINADIDKKGMKEKKIDINGNSGVSLTGEEKNIVYWNDGEHYFGIAGNIHVNYLIKMAENASAGDENTGYNYKKKIYTSDWFRINYIPDGMRLEERVDTNDYYITSFLMFAGEDGYIQFSIQPNTVNSSFDTENATIGELVINGYDAVSIDAPDFYSVIWYTEKHQIRIFGTIPMDEIIKIAESVVTF